MGVYGRCIGHALLRDALGGCIGVYWGFIGGALAMLRLHGEVN